MPPIQSAREPRLDDGAASDRDLPQETGEPLILDDALGYSDPGRLEAMGAVLALAGRSCQVILLTCYPERYRHVGGAAIRQIG